MTEPTTEALAASLTALVANPDDAPHAALLLADHLALVSAAGGPATGAPSESAAREAELGALADRDDVHWGALVHPGAIVWPTVLALGAGASGTELLRAATIGYETCVLLTAALDPALRPALHATTATGVVAAAAVACALLDDGRVLPDALGHAISVAWGSTAAFRELSGTRAFHRAHAVRTGTAAAEAARRGLSATKQQLDVAPSAPWTAGAVLTAEGAALRETSLRVFPTSGWNQTAYEAARAAARPGELRSVTVTVAQLALDRSRPPADPWNNIETAAAAGAAAGSGDQRSIAELLPLVTVRASTAGAAPVGEGGLGASAEVETAGGRDRAEISIPAGHPTRPAELADVAAAWGIDPATALSRIRRIADLLRSSEPGAASAIRATGADHPTTQKHEEPN